MNTLSAVESESRLLAGGLLAKCVTAMMVGLPAALILLLAGCSPDKSLKRRIAALESDQRMIASNEVVISQCLRILAVRIPAYLTNSPPLPPGPPGAPSFKPLLGRPHGSTNDLTTIPK